jgi:pimeloyl-ACP methyl ester carboxylesterase
MPTITIDGQPIFYRKYDRNADPARPPLVLVHGAGGTLTHWPPQVRRLPRTAVYALDLPGHGKSAGPGYTTVEAYADVVARFIEALGLPPAVLAGHSMGGAIVQDVALRYPDKVAGLALIATGARLKVAPLILDGLYGAFDETVTQIAGFVYSPRVDPEERAAYLAHLQGTDPALLHGDFAACNAFDARPRLAAITQPALIICGTEDRMTPPKFSRYLHELLPDSELHLIEDAGHMVMLERPDAVADLIQDFLERRYG